VQQRQKETESELRAIQIVVAALVPAEQFAHLESIANDPNYSPSVFDSVRKELRNLRGMGFLKSCPGKYIGAMPEGRVALREWVELTPKDKEYLQLREQYAKE